MDYVTQGKRVSLQKSSWIPSVVAGKSGPVADLKTSTEDDFHESKSRHHEPYQNQEDADQNNH